MSENSKFINLRPEFAGEIIKFPESRPSLTDEEKKVIEKELFKIDKQIFDLAEELAIMNDVLKTEESARPKQKKKFFHKEKKEEKIPPQINFDDIKEGRQLIAEQIKELRREQAELASKLGPEYAAEMAGRLNEVRGIRSELETLTSKINSESASTEQITTAIETIGKQNVFGPEEVEKTFGIRLEAENIPEIPFSKEDLERAKELGQFLILRVDKTAGGQPLTVEKMQETLQPKLDKEKSGKILYSTDWYKNQDFFKKDTPKLGWALVAKNVIPDSTNKNFINQTAILAGYLKDKVFKGGPLPKQYQEAIGEFEKKKVALEQLIGSNWQKAAKQLSELKLTRLTRQSPTEVIYDLLVLFQSGPNKDRLLEKTQTWTGRLSSYGKLVCVGGFDVGGAIVSSWNPDVSNDDIGVSFSRSH